MKIKILLSILFVILQSCNKTAGQKKTGKENVVKNDSIKKDTIPVKNNTEVKISQLSKESVITITYKGYIGDIAVKYYGNKAYQLPLAVYNNLKEGYYVKQKIEFYIPTFSAMVKDANLGLKPSIHKEVDLLLLARELYMKHEISLQHLRINKEPVVIPENIKTDLDKAISLISQVNISLKKRDNSPKKMIGQLEKVVKNLKKISNGSNDGYGYDLDMVHQRLAHAFKNGMVWSKEN